MGVPERENGGEDIIQEIKLRNSTGGPASPNRAQQNERNKALSLEIFEHQGQDSKNFHRKKE